MTESRLPTLEGAVCPVPLSHKDQIMLGHGSGGKLSHDLITSMFLPAFDNPALRAGDDAGLVQPNACTQLAISTDSHVVWPLFFPGGDIGRLAVCGTVNDVSMLGARPLYLTAGFVLEEGLDINTTGIGMVMSGVEIGGRLAQPGDVVILSGSIGDHGIAVLAARGELGFETDICSD